jgi:hypothetical protein
MLQRAHDFPLAALLDPTTLSFQPDRSTLVEKYLSPLSPAPLTTPEFLRSTHAHG